MTQAERIHQITYQGEPAEERLDRFLAAALPDHSRAHLQRLIKDGLVTIDGVVVRRPSTRLGGGETLVVRIPEAEPQPLEAEPIALDIVYQDEQIVVVNKPAGMIVHPGAGHASGTLVNALLAYLPQLALVGGERRPGIVHRLDKDTSGLIVVALTEPARLALKAQFQARQVQKRYLALAEGIVTPAEGLIDVPIGRSKADRRQMTVLREGRPAQTEYHTLETFRVPGHPLGGYSLIEALPKTGRTHQIRVHLAFLGFPLAGDRVYGRRRRTVRALRRHFLHAHHLAFLLPGTGEEAAFAAPLPNDLAHVLKWLRANWS